MTARVKYVFLVRRYTLVFFLQLGLQRHSLSVAANSYQTPQSCTRSDAIEPICLCCISCRKTFLLIPLLYAGCAFLLHLVRSVAILELCDPNRFLLNPQNSRTCSRVRMKKLSGFSIASFLHILFFPFIV